MDFKTLVPESIRGFLNGNGTYITGFLYMLISVLCFGGLDMSMFMVNPSNASQIFTIGLSAVLLRRGVTNEVKKINV